MVLNINKEIEKLKREEIELNKKLNEVIDKIVKLEKQEKERLDLIKIENLKKIFYAEFLLFNYDKIKEIDSAKKKYRTLLDTSSYLFECIPNNDMEYATKWRIVCEDKHRNKIITTRLVNDLKLKKAFKDDISVLIAEYVMNDFKGVS